MEQWTQSTDPSIEWAITWGFRIFVAVLCLLALRALFNRTLSKEDLEKELTGEDKEDH